ncbi:MAG: hypothetical protein HQL49_08260 [Gammaproteobacteria bacterium]|nr:hypothetical protein [Gammaproteobacteria bacterium]
MEKILEIRDGCNSPSQLLKSHAFTRYLEIYKDAFIKDLCGHDERRQGEAQRKITFIRSITARDFLEVLESNHASLRDVPERHRALVRFIDGMFHHFRGSGYARLIRLQNDVVTGDETPDTVKDKVTAKAQNLSDLIVDGRRAILRRVFMEQGVRRTVGLDASPNVAAGEISGHYLNLPNDYFPLAAVPLTIAADIQTGVDYETPSNKRAHPFYELTNNPFNPDTFNSEEWVSVPLQVGTSLIVAYIHKSRGCIEMEPGLLNIFPFADVVKIRDGRRPDGIFLFGDPVAPSLDRLGYYWDDKNKVLIGLVPNIDELKYFGYCKKPILTLHNVLAIRANAMPLHCGCTRYVVNFDQQGNALIADMYVKADDMGRIELVQGADGVHRPIFYGTETGAFACLDGFSEQAKLQMRGREVGYNSETGTNARQVVPVTIDEEVLRGDQLDILLYMNNFILIENGQPTINTAISVNEAIEHFRLGERVASGSTHSHRGKKESSYWANPFPLLKSNSGKVIHTDLYNRFSETEQLFICDAHILCERHELSIGIAHSQLMAGVFIDNSDEDVIRCGYANTEAVEQEGPVRLAEDLIELIKKTAIKKRERSGGKVEEVSITVALVGDSRTGKSETAEKMEGVLGLQLI